MKKPSLPNIEALIAFVENLRIQEELRLQEEAKQIKLHNQRNAKCRIQRKKFLESQEVKVETQPTPKKGWRKKVSSPKTPYGDDNRTEVQLRTQNPRPRHEVRGTYPSFALHIG